MLEMNHITSLLKAIGLMPVLQVGYTTIYKRIKLLKDQGVLIRKEGRYDGMWKINEVRYSQLYPSSEPKH